MDAKSLQLIDRFVNVRIGEPYRLFPFGTLHKNGTTVELTPEVARTFKLPHFKPAIKLGGHEDNLPAAGHIIGLEVRADGVYAIPEWNDNGTAALEGGAFRYHSPEIIWEGAILDSLTGKEIEAPIIMGDALLHNPALGEATAFYKVQKYGGNTMSEMTQVPTPLWEKFSMWIDNAVKPQPEPTPTPEPSPDVSKYEAELEEAKAQVAEYKAQVEAMEAAAGAAARIAHFGEVLQDSPAVAEDHELHALLARLEDDAAEALVKKFKALSAQIDEFGMTGEAGEAGDDTPVDATSVVALAEKYAAEHEISYTAAIGKLAVERPELFREVR